MEQPSEVGRSIVIKGQVTAREDLVISGRVEGSITVTGHVVTVRPEAEVAADVEARSVVIAGRVVGTVCAEERIALQSTSDVEGGLEAPALRVEDGARFNGDAHTTKAKAGLQLAS